MLGIIVFMGMNTHDNGICEAFVAVLSNEKRADHSLRDEQICCNQLSFLCAVAPRFSC